MENRILKKIGDELKKQNRKLHSICFTYCLGMLQEVGVVIHCAYGSSKDIGVYASVGLEPNQIYVVGKTSRKHHNSAVVCPISFPFRRGERPTTYK